MIDRIQNDNPEPVSSADEALAALRVKAERHLVYPLNRDECLALVAIAEAARAYEAEMSNVAHEWRMDWSDFDGRTLMHQEADASHGLNAALAALVPGSGDET